MAQQPLVARVSSLSRLLYYTQTPHSVGLLWTSDQPEAEISTWQHASLTGDRHPCPLEKFEPVTTASKLPQTHLLDRTVTGIRKFRVISHWTLLGMKNVSDKSCRENSTHFMFGDFLSKNRAVYEVTCKNVVELYRARMTVHHGACAFHAG